MMNVALFGVSVRRRGAGMEARDGDRVAGGGDPDLAAAAPGGGARLTAIAVSGGIDVRVPAGTRIAVSGLSLLGGRDVRVPPGEGPTIRVRAFAILGGVTIRPSEG